MEDTRDPQDNPAPVLNAWLASLPPDAREIIMLARDNIERLDGNVQMADALATLAFKRAVEAGAGLTSLTPKEQTDLFKVAGGLVNVAAQLKEQRIRLNDDFKGILDLPKPAHLEYLVVESSAIEQVRRLIAMDMRSQAEVLARQHGIDLVALTNEAHSMETPEEDI